MVVVREEPITSALDEHASISIAFEVETVYDVDEAANGSGLVLTERRVDVPWVKDYDADKGEGPTRWANRFDLTNWGLLSAWDGDDRVGGAVVAYDTDDVHMLQGRHDLAVLWDIRVDPGARGSGVGSALFVGVENWARERACRWLKVETQNINVPACKFYTGRGCTLGAIDRFAYPELPDEVMLLWYKELR